MKKRSWPLHLAVYWRTRTQKDMPNDKQQLAFYLNICLTSLTWVHETQLPLWFDSHLERPPQRQQTEVRGKLALQLTLPLPTITDALSFGDQSEEQANPMKTVSWEVCFTWNYTKKLEVNQKGSHYTSCLQVNGKDFCRTCPGLIIIIIIIIGGGGGGWGCMYARILPEKRKN